jgi:RNA polymerase sigma-70 factor, ECF subfamily
MTAALEDAPQSCEDEAAFRAMLTAIVPSLRSFARGMCGNRDTADDLAQEAIMRAWAARGSYTAGTNFRAWMFMILRNHYFSHLRKNSRVVPCEPELAERVLVTGPGQHAHIDLADLEKALQKLPEDQREVLILVGANGMSYQEAAEIIGCAIGTIKSRVARGRAALAVLIDGKAAPDEHGQPDDLGRDAA